MYNLFFYLQKKEADPTDLWNALMTAGKKMEERAEMRRGENESGVEKPLMGAVSSHVIPLIAFQQLSQWQDCRERKAAPTHTHIRLHARRRVRSVTVWQSCQGRVEMTPYFRVPPPLSFTSTTHKLTVSLPASEATITVCTERGFYSAEGNRSYYAVY